MFRSFLLAGALALLGATPAFASDDESNSIGFGAGATQLLQPAVNASIRAVFENVFETRFGITSRDLALVPNGTGGVAYGLQVSSADLSLGLTFGPISLGYVNEVALLHNVQIQNGGLVSSAGVGYVGEGYAGLLIGSRSSMALELQAFYPVVKADPSLAPRAMAMLWIPLDK